MKGKGDDSGMGSKGRSGLFPLDLAAPLHKQSAKVKGAFFNSGNQVWMGGFWPPRGEAFFAYSIPEIWDFWEKFFHFSLFQVRRSIWKCLARIDGYNNFIPLVYELLLLPQGDRN